MAVREEYSPENRVIALTGIVGDSAPTIGQHWRTVVLQPSSSPPHYPELRAGWPVDLGEGGLHDEQPRAVAIYSDNSVYVTGFTSQNNEDDWFTTVRYKPTGNPNAEFWRYDWAPFQSKPTGGYDIALDKDGDAYATGVVVVAEPEAANYGTIAFEKDPDSGGNAVVKWAKDYDYQGYSDIARSISLSFEVENGALVPYVFVTGQVQEEQSATNVATVRYRGSDGNEEWVQIYNGHATIEEVGLDVIGAGYGNAYVLGRSNEDLFVIGYKRDSSMRLGPLTYHFVDFDEGRMGAMVGAGALVATGASDGSGTSADFVSQRFFQTTAASSPSSYLVRVGTYISGGLSDLTASDDSFMVFKETVPVEPDGPSIRVEFSGATNVNDPTEIAINFEGRCNVSGVQEIELFDRLTSSWVVIDKRATTVTDTRLKVVVKDDPGRFVNSGVLKARVSYRAPTAIFPGWMAHVDLLTWDVLGG